MDPASANAPGTAMPVTTNPAAPKVKSEAKQSECPTGRCPRNKWWEQYNIFRVQQEKADARHRLIEERKRAW